MNSTFFPKLNNVPQSRLVVFKDKSGNSILPNIKLIMEDAVKLKVSSKYDSIWDPKGTDFLTLISSSSPDNSAMSKLSGQFAIQGAKIWKSTDPLELDLELSVYMEESGKKDVVEPILTLMSFVLPTKSDALVFGKNEGLMGLRKNIKLETLIPPGPNLQSIIGAMEAENEELNANLRNGSKGTFTVDIGTFLTIPNVIIESVEPTFAETYDEDGFPISAKISVHISTMTIATTDMMKDIIQYNHN